MAPRDRRTQEAEADVAHSLLWNIWRPKEYRPNLIFLWNVLELVILTCPKVNHGPEEAARSEHAGFESQIFLPLALPRIFSKTRGGEKADRTVFSQNKNDSPASLENNLKLPGREQRESPPAALRPAPSWGASASVLAGTLGSPGVLCCKWLKSSIPRAWRDKYPLQGQGRGRRGAARRGHRWWRPHWPCGPHFLVWAVLGVAPAGPRPPQTTPPGAGTDPASPAPSAA